nr:hypothetical protein [Tanacetum cinerariifolium]
VDLEPDDGMKDSGCSKHTTGNRKLFSSYKAYKGDNVEHVDNLGFILLSIGQICYNKCRVTFSEHDSEITKDGKVIGKQAHASHKAKHLVSTTRCLELLHIDLFGPSSVRSYEGNRYTLVIVDDYSRKVEESLNVTFDETPSPSKTSPLVDDDLDEEEAIKVTEKKNLENDIVDETLEIDEIVSIKESRNHQLENYVNKALGDESWIVAMQEELNQFIANDVWELVPQPKNMTIIGTKWVFKNKLDENGVVSQNKGRLVAQDFKLFPMDVKSAFMNGFINEEVYVAQPSGFIDFEKPDHVYKLKKALYGLKQTPKAWMLFDILVLEETNRSCYIHYRRRIGHKDHVSACLCHILYCIESSTSYNLAFFILKRMEKTRNKPKKLLPYGMLLTRLFKHVVSIFPELAFDHYLSHDRAMHPLAPRYERKMRSDHGKKRPRELNTSPSSSTTQNYPSLSLPLDATDDENDEESFHSHSSSPSQNISSSSNVVPRKTKNVGKTSVEAQDINSKSSPSSQKDPPSLPPRVYLQSPSPPSYNPLRDQMINQLHNISTILDSHTNPSNAYIRTPPYQHHNKFIIILMLKLNFT